MSVLIGEKSFMCGRTVKLNRQGKTFACVLAMRVIGDAFVSIPSQMFSRQYITKSITDESDFPIVHLMLFFTTDYAYIIG